MNIRLQRGASACTRHTLGFSLVETMVVVAMTAVLAGLAAPSFTAFFERYRVVLARDQLVMTLQFARTEAIRTGQQIVIRRKAGCPVNNWGCGWEVFQDLNRDGTRQAPGETLSRDVEEVRDVSIRVAGLFPNLVTIDNFGNARSPFSYRIGPKGNAASHECMQMAVNFGMRTQYTTGTSDCP